MKAANENQLFLEALHIHLDELSALLGEDWPWFHEQLLSIQRRLLEAENEAEISEGIDDILDLLVDTPAGGLVRQLLRQAQAEPGFSEVHTRSAGERKPTESPASPPEAAGAAEVLEARLLSLLPRKADGYAVVPVFYATDRARAKKGFYSGERSELELGVAEISIPANRSVGELDGPRWWRLEFRDDPRRHVAVLSVEAREREAFVADLRSALSQAPAPAVLLFVHGYNVTFVDAARRAAQLAFDLDYQGVPFLYSWPSAGRTLKYAVDATNVGWTAPHFEDVLRLVLDRVEPRSMDVIAHSMGNRAVVAALSGLGSGSATKLRHIVLAAPDIDAATFRDLARHFPGRAQRFTLYASSRDRALWFSKRFNGYPRAGDSGESLVIVADVLDTVDATAVDTSLLGHSYYGDNRSIVSDIHTLLRYGGAPPRFGMSQRDTAAGTYWLFRP